MADLKNFGENTSLLTVTKIRKITTIATILNYTNTD